MNGRNGYFQITHKQDGTYLKLFDADPGGQPIRYDEIYDYLYEKKIYEYDKIGLGKALATLKDSAEVKLNSISITSLDESLKITLTEDHMYAYGRFYPPSEGGQLLTKEDIINLLVKAGVKYGVDDISITKFLTEKRYCTDYTLAKALPAEQGHDAEITYFFNTDLTYRPKLNEDGTVDFHQLDMISHCKKGDILASLVPMDPGKPGIDVCGKVIRPTKVQNRILRHGNKAHLSEDGLKVYADVDGHVSLTEGRIFVADTYEIQADVDSSTGDIDYNGNVIIKGNVITGFTVKAKGDIEVNGVVEGAYIEAGGHIILRRGMQGMYKGVLKAYGNIASKFIENAEVIAGGYITTEAILHSKVSAKGDIIVSGRKGLVTGGEIRSGTMISVKTAGSQMGTNTLLSVGVDPKLLDEKRELEKQLETLQADKLKLEQTIALYRKKLAAGAQITKEQLESLKKIAGSNLYLENQIKELQKRYEELKLSMESNETGKINIADTVYPGTKIIIASAVYIVRETIQHSRFIKDRADIKIVAL